MLRKSNTYPSCFEIRLEGMKSMIQNWVASQAKREDPNKDGCSQQERIDCCWSWHKNRSDDKSVAEWYDYVLELQEVLAEWSLMVVLVGEEKTSKRAFRLELFVKTREMHVDKSSSHIRDPFLTRYVSYSLKPINQSSSWLSSYSWTVPKLEKISQE
jgi:hypothetical protein